MTSSPQRRTHLIDVLRRRHRAGDDVHLDLEAHAAHADRLAHAALAVDDEFLGQDVQDLLLGRDRHRARDLDHALDVERRDLLLLDRDHAAGVEALDVAAGDAGVDLVDLAVGHQLDLLHDARDRIHRGLDVHHHAALEAVGRLGAEADHVEPPVGLHLGDHAGDLGGADVQADDQFVVLLAHFLPFRAAGATGCCSTEASTGVSANPLA
jgi:hypothetical protein